MDGLASTELEDSLPRFTPAEIREMELLLKEVGEKSPSKEFCQELATSFSRSTHRTGKSSVKWEQVRSWFQDKQKELAVKVTISPVAPEDPPLDFTIMNNAPECHQKPEVGSVVSFSELIFEAKSSKDNAWYDVGSFLNHRYLHNGELEVRVRFAGFGYEEDEWVNVERGVRERSIPLEPSECDRVEVGDLVLCFRETDDEAIYCDAHVMEIRRRLHDIRGCRCIFAVRFDHDKVEEKVKLNRLCCRPK